MPCYGDKYKQTCSKIVIGASILMGLMALLSIVFGVIQMGKVPMTESQKSVFQIQGLDNSAGIGKGNVAIGVVGLLISCLGCLTGKKKNICFALPYGLLTFVVTIIFLVIAIISGGLGSQTGQTMLFNGACGLDVVIPKMGSTASKTMKSNINLAAKYTKFVDQPICSMYCPCPSIAAFQASDKNLTQAKLLKWGRYVNTASSGLNSNANGYTTTPSSDKIDGLLQLQFAKAGSTTKAYSTYKECYLQVLSKSSSGSSSSDTKAKNFKATLSKFINGGGFDLLADFENKYSCAGFCVTPLFYATKSVTMRPEQECIKPIVANVASFAKIVSIIAGISFVVNLCGFCGSFSLCTKMEGNDDDK